MTLLTNPDFYLFSAMFILFVLLCVFLYAAKPRKFPCKDCGLLVEGDMHRCPALRCATCKYCILVDDTNQCRIDAIDYDFETLLCHEWEAKS